MLVQQIDVVGAQSTQRIFRAAADGLRSAIELSGLVSLRIEVKAKLRRDDHARAVWRQRFADDILVRERPVYLRGVEESDPALDRAPNERNRLRAVRRGPESVAQSHTAEAELRDLQPAPTECARVHELSP